MLHYRISGILLAVVVTLTSFSSGTAYAGTAMKRCKFLEVKIQHGANWSDVVELKRGVLIGHDSNPYWTVVTAEQTLHGPEFAIEMTLYSSGTAKAIGTYKLNVQQNFCFLSAGDITVKVEKDHPGSSYKITKGAYGSRGTKAWHFGSGFLQLLKALPISIIDFIYCAIHKNFQTI